MLLKSRPAKPPRQQGPGTPVINRKYGSHQSRPQLSAQGNFFAQLLFDGLLTFKGCVGQPHVELSSAGMPTKRQPGLLGNRGK